MELTEQIADARRARKRRSTLGNIAWGAVVLLVLGSLTALGRSPLVALATLGMAIAYTGTRMYVEGKDELQRRRAVQSCAIGCGAGIAWVAIDAVRVAVTGDAPGDPSRTLAIAAAAWMITELLVGLRHDPTAGESSEVTT